MSELLSQLRADLHRRQREIATKPLAYVTMHEWMHMREQKLELQKRIAERERDGND